MGDEYIVTRTVRCGKAWYYSHLLTMKNESRICCHGTHLLSTTDAYFKDIQVAQKDALNGLNPYVTKHYAHSYLAASRNSRDESNSTHHDSKRQRKKHVTFNV